MSSLTTLADWLRFQEQQHAQTIDLGLERIRSVAERLQLTTLDALVVSVAGTNGKGSSTAALAAIYTQAGYTTGWYSSPHLLHYNERIAINNQPVSDHDLIDAFSAIMAVLHAQETLSYFEWGTLAALWLFRQQQCQVCILEVGLGGRLDAVNILDADAALITPIDLDHQAWLGHCREDIALEKAGILRTKQLAVYADPNPVTQLIDYAQSLGVHLYLPQRDYQWQRQDDHHWLWQTTTHAYVLPYPKLLGDFQLANMSAVLMLIQQLQPRLPVPASAIAQGLTQIRLIGRLDYRHSQHATWLFDVAHNAQSMTALTQYLAQIAANYDAIVVVFSALVDKDVASMITQLAPWVQRWYIAPLHQARAMPVEQLMTLAQAQLDRRCLHVFDYIDAACQAASSESARVLRLVCGSFVTVEQGLRWLEGMS